MNIVLLKSRNDNAPIIVQQKQIMKYAHHHDLKIDTTEIENSDPTLELEERKEFKGFLRSLSKNDHIIIFDLSTFSNNMEDLVKVFECLLTRSISIHIADANVCIHVDAKPLMLLELLVKQRELNQTLDIEKAQGRPKGRMSKSKFDMYRPQVIELLENRTSISEIAKILHVSRTSLKDYVNSRGLKELVKAKITLLQSSRKPPLNPAKYPVVKECSLIKQPIDQPEGIHHELS